MPTAELSMDSTVSMTPKKVRHNFQMKKMTSNLNNIAWCNLIWDIDKDA